MGHFSYSCGLTGLPITGGDDIVFVPMVRRESLYENDLSTFKKYGKSSMISNDGTRLFFIPCMIPIKGKYDDYGGIEQIEETDATKILEDHFGLPIQAIANVLTSGRKDDGFDDALDAIKDDSKAQRDNEGNLDPKYKARFKPLLRISGTWFRREVYDRLESIAIQDDYDKLDLGTPALLKKLGFEELSTKGKDKRYNRQFKKGDLVVNSDGTCINIPDKSVYTLPSFAEYCKEKGEPLDDEIVNGLNRQSSVGQLIDVVIPEKESLLSSASLLGETTSFPRLETPLTEP